jgi:DNA-3-methyladenine glycosylase I
VESGYRIRPLSEDDRDWVARFLSERWGSVTVISRGRLHQADRLPGFAALQADSLVGLATYNMDGDECEIVTLDSLAEGLGIGSALIATVKQKALDAGCRRLWLITTNDNLNALGFYQKRGFALAALHRNAIEKSRRLKPEIPLIGMDGIPLRDEIELELEIGG